MPLDNDLRSLREKRLQYGSSAVPSSLQGVPKSRVREVLKHIDRGTPDMVDTVFALLDNETDSFFKKSPEGTKFCDGATTAHIGSHVGILQRRGAKLDREGRDYWIKPLRELGAILPIYFDPKTRTFAQGHPVAKSPNSAYRLSEDFVQILKAPKVAWPQLLDDWVKKENIRKRAKLQAEVEENARQQVDSSHEDLIIACQVIYAAKFLPGYKVIFIDVADGQRITSQEKASLAEAGLSLSLADAMPDVLLWNPKLDSIWVIEAVTSDGEVDSHKVTQILAMAGQHGKHEVGFTTAYATWRDAARRQGRHKNIAPETYIWIQEDPSKHFHVIAMSAELSARGLTT